MRSKLHESDRLLGLADCRNLPELFRRVRPAETFAGHLEFERQLAGDAVRQLDTVSRYLSGRSHDLFRWLLVRFQVDNIKVALHAYVGHESPAEAERLTVAVPAWMRLDMGSLFQAPNLRRFAAALSVKELRNSMVKLLDAVETPDSDAIELALDSAHLATLGSLASPSRGRTRELIGRDIDARNVLLMLRARFNFNRDLEAVKSSIAPGGARLTRYGVGRIAAARGLPEALAAASAICLPSRYRTETVSLRQLEDALVVAQYRFATRCFAEAVLDEALVFAYYYIKRAELANLVRLTEGIRHGLTPDEIKERLLLPGGP